MAARRVTRRPYRVALLGGGKVRRATYATAERALAAATEDAYLDTDLYLTTERQYVVEYHDPSGHWLPQTVVQIAGSGRVVRRETASQAGMVVA